MSNCGENNCYHAGISKDGKEVFLTDIWPTREELQVCDFFVPLLIFFFGGGDGKIASNK